MKNLDDTAEQPRGLGQSVGSIYVCPLSAVTETVLNCRATHLLTCLQDELLVETPHPIEPRNHLRLRIHDISEPMLGCVAPSEEHIEQLLEFAHAWGGRGPMVVHCFAGISRSTAAAFISLCAINQDAPEELIARRLREASPTACPNRLMVRLGDAALGRNGRMTRAIEGIGRGIIAAEARPFSIPADLSAKLTERNSL